MQITIIKHNDVFLKIHAEKSILQELSNYFSFKVPGYQFTPAYKNKIWNGFIYLFNNNTHQIYIGLYDKIVEFCQKSNYTISEDSYKPTQNPVSRESIESYIKDTLQPASKGVKLDVRGYQINVVHHCITEGRSTILSPTSSGKSLMLYSLIRYLLDNNMAKRVLFIFPSISLVNQLLTDFTDYSSINKWDAKSQSHMIFAGKEKITEHPLVFSTCS
jgi:reverse gyrase